MIVNAMAIASRTCRPSGRMITFGKIAQWAACLLALLLVGSLGFVWLEGWNFFDALYMTVTTLTTVGYGETHPLDRIGRIYNMVLILTGMGVMFYIVGSLARVVIEGELQAVLGRRKLIKHIKRLKNHYILCGFGRIGEIIARQLKERGLSLVVIENDPALLARLEASGYYFINGDATREEVLLEAGIERAKGLIAVVSSDAANVYIVLTARSLNPNLFIVARGEEPGSEKKLLRAGADKVESPYRDGRAENGPDHPAPHRGDLYGTGHEGGGGLEHGGDRGGPRLSPPGGAAGGLGDPPEPEPHPGGHQAGRRRDALQPQPRNPDSGRRHPHRPGAAEKPGRPGEDGAVRRNSCQRSAFSFSKRTRFGNATCRAGTARRYLRLSGTWGGRPRPPLSRRDGA